MNKAARTRPDRWSIERYDIRITQARIANNHLAIEQTLHASFSFDRVQLERV